MHDTSMQDDEIGKNKLKPSPSQLAIDITLNKFKVIIPFLSSNKSSSPGNKNSQISGGQLRSYSKPNSINNFNKTQRNYNYAGYISKSSHIYHQQSI